VSRRAVLATAAAVALAAVVAAAWWWLRQPAGDDGAARPGGAPGDELRLAVELYFPGTGTTLERERRELAVADDPEQQLAALARALAEGPRRPGMNAPLPPGVEVRGVSLGQDGVVYVDLVSEDGSPPPAGGSTEERLRVYSLVNTLVLNVAEAKSAVLLWNGAQPATLSGHLDLSRPLLPDPSVVSPSRPAPPPEGGAR
jgi:hypothetical protein